MTARIICQVYVDPVQHLALVRGVWQWLLVEQAVGPDYLARAFHGGFVLTMAELADLGVLAHMNYAVWREREQEFPKPHRKGRGIKVT